MSTIRPMRAEDADAICEVHFVAFQAWVKQLRGEQDQAYRRTRLSVLASLEKDPAGCFVSEKEGNVVGCILSRTWGSVGWFGTFTVLPEHQGQGIGKRLISASMDYLRQDHDRAIGLETIPDSPYNLGLYLKLGFQARLLTPMLSKTLDNQTADNAVMPLWSQASVDIQTHWLADLQQAGERLYPGHDYSKEILSTARHGLGETLVLTDGGRAIGLSTVGLVSPWESMEPHRAHIEVLALHPVYTNDQTFGILMGASENFARAHGRQVLTLSVNARHVRALERLLERGYRVRGTMLRMVLQGTDRGPAVDDHANLSRWAG